MKKSICFILVIVTIGFSGCITNDKADLPIETITEARLKLVNYPTNSDKYILGVGDYLNEVDFVLRDCFTNEYIVCTDSLGNIKDYIILFLGEGYNDDAPYYSLEIEDLYKEDGDEYYVKIYLAQHKKIDYEKQQSNPLNYLDTIEIDIDDYVRIKHEITYKDDNQWVWYKARRIPSYRLLMFLPYKE